MKRQYLNLTHGAWRQLRRNWQLAPSPILLWQTLAPGTLFSALTGLQRTAAREQLVHANLKDAIVILGYWRSGTTLLHELLSLDPRRCFPTTHACMNPHHFLLTEASALARGSAGVKRPMDEMEVRPGSPQEDEFALLSLGARSPYEALIAPHRLRQALELADPRDLPAREEEPWRSLFVDFLRGVSARGAGRPMILKSPTHGYRVSTLRELLPDARFILIARDPATHFESVIRMWRRMFETYSLGEIPGDDEIREAVLVDRPRFEAKLAAGVAGLPGNRFAELTYESLIADPIGACEGLYGSLDLGDFAPAHKRIAAEVERRRDYRATGRQPAGAWRGRINSEWAAVFERYGYARL
ncbi:MAG: sulfotransferase [Bryobacteraceae bacterium]|jgi:omega-hydroxy-beta-dihydromenaquinone-9 sulfotransferase